MKILPLVLATSLVANAVLLGVLAKRSFTESTVQPSGVASSRTPQASAQRELDALRTALHSGDAAALEAAGLSPETARELVVGRVFSRAAERIRAARASQPADERWWRNRTGSATREQQLRNRRELSDALVAAFGDDLGLLGGNDATQFAFLPAAKRDALRRITQDYDEMMAAFNTGGLQLPSDRERLKLLRAERDRDLAALLTPEELEAYHMRTSASAAVVRGRYGDGIETEEDFRRIYALQKAFDEKYAFDGSTGRISPETMRARSEAQRQLQDDIRASLGDDKYAALRRASDSDLRTVDGLAARLNLPAGTTDRVASARETFASQSQQINADTSLTPQQRRAQLQDLGARAKAELTQALGAEAGEAYAQRSPWVGMLQNGMAYSTTPSASAAAAPFGGSLPVHPVPPPGATGPGTTRQAFTLAAPAAVDGVVHADAFATPGGVQVMTFSTSVSETAAAAPDAASGKRVIVAPPGAPAETPPKR